MRTSAMNMNLEKSSLSGYQTVFDFKRDDVRKGWWRYAREFGQPVNMKSYYKVIVPATSTDGNIDIEIFTKTTIKESGGVTFFLGVDNEKYKKQALAMILEFKKQFYIQYLTKQIAKKQDEASGLSRQYMNQVLDSKKKEFLDRIIQISAEIDDIKTTVKTIEKG